MTVTDSLGGVAAAQGFSFYTNATKYDKPPDESDLDNEVREKLPLAFNKQILRLLLCCCAPSTRNAHAHAAGWGA